MKQKVYAMLINTVNLTFYQSLFPIIMLFNQTKLSGSKKLLAFPALELTSNINNDRLTLSSYFDADWACNPDDRKSTAGYCVYFGDTLLSGSSKKQDVVSKSSIESEYRGFSSCFL
ncbi:hypothetical protein UlMin_027862 [Ulmus minor]